MPKFTTKLVARSPAAEGTMSFFFERPPNFNFKAGQFFTVILSNPPYNDEKGNRRTFSIASAPQEAARLQMTTRLTGSALKRSLAEIALGTPVELLGPAGTFTLHADTAIPAVFIAGGIGITPFRSMILDAVARNLPHQITLIYSNRNLEGAAFHEELQQLALASKNFKYVPTLTQADKSPHSWNGERRYVNAAFLRDHAGDLGKAIFYLAGPPGLVTALSKTLTEAGVNPERVLAEEFEGY
ncbi:MAG: FAD-dependent oxidoreductase [candidate division KSB1 bacterium]|nr:FAD-dependent oxidoreductase [candidate division KSB1 bacterium]MDZ7367367.1 FAD-dependent oxidoreductase [candidate division KSB1 bacterium]MDZ7405248.1 FAD-dependent oxidoreductase [candidate division KSB1 bacterium]